MSDRKSDVIRELEFWMDVLNRRHRRRFRAFLAVSAVGTVAFAIALYFVLMR